MNKKALLVLLPLFAMASLLVMPAFASNAPTIVACGWAYEKTHEGCVSGCATLIAAVGAADGATPAFDTLSGGFVILEVQGYAFEWVIDQSTVKCKCNVLTFCASPFAPEVGAGVDPSVEFTTPLSPISVVIDLCKPYCVTAFGCSTFFTGQGHVATAP